MPDISKAEVRQRPSPCYVGLSSVGKEGPGDASVQALDCRCWQGLAVCDSQTQHCRVDSRALYYQEAVEEGGEEHILCSLPRQLSDPSFLGSQIQMVFLNSTVPVGFPNCAKIVLFGCSVANILEFIPGGPA